jgi:RNA polymerase sigma-70 factor (ECF subfamily)
MDEHDWLAERFETDRPGLRPLAYRLLGPAEEAGREEWTRLGRGAPGAAGVAGAAGVPGVAGVAADGLDGRMRTTVAQVTLHMLRSGPVVQMPEVSGPPADLPRSVRVTLLVVCETLLPPERLACVLQDMFAAPFEEIAALAALANRELAGSARRPGTAAGYGGTGNDRGPFGSGTDAGATTGADIAGAFLAASRGGDFRAMLTALDPNRPARRPAADTPPASPGPAGEAAPHPAPAEHRGGDAVIGTTEVRGTESVTRVCTVRTWTPIPALIDGAAGLVWVQNGHPRVAFRFTVEDGEVTATELETDLSALSIVY